MSAPTPPRPPEIRKGSVSPLGDEQAEKARTKMLEAAEMRWMSVEDSTIIVRARALAELGRDWAAALAELDLLRAAHRMVCREVVVLREAVSTVTYSVTASVADVDDVVAEFTEKARGFASEETTA